MQTIQSIQRSQNSSYFKIRIFAVPHAYGHRKLMTTKKIFISLILYCRQSPSNRRTDFPPVCESGRCSEWKPGESTHSVPEHLQHKAAHRVGEGVPLQQVLDARAAVGDRERAAAPWGAGQSVVPKQAHETEENTAASAHTSSTGKLSGITRKNDGHVCASREELVFTSLLLAICWSFCALPPSCAYYAPTLVWIKGQMTDVRKKK